MCVYVSCENPGLECKQYVSVELLVSEQTGEMNSALGFLILQVVLLVVAARDFSIDHANNTFVKVGINNVLRTCFYICTIVYPYTNCIQINKHVLIHDSIIV